MSVFNLKLKFVVALVLLASFTITNILSAPLIPLTVVVLPLNEVPPAFNKVQLAPPPAGAAHANPVAVAESATKQ